MQKLSFVFQIILLSFFLACGLSCGGKASFRSLTGIQQDGESSAEKNAAASGDAQGGIANAEVVDSFKIAQQSEAASVDVVILFDTSGSMSGDGQEQERLEAQLPTFLKQLQENLTANDYQVYLVGNMNYQPASSEKIFKIHPSQNIRMKVGSHDALRVFSDFLDYQNGDKFPFPKLRADGILELIIFSDDNATARAMPDRLTDPREFFQQTVKTHHYENRIRLHGAVGLASSQKNAWCDISQTGDVYIELAKSTGGLIQDLCSEDWSQLMQDFGSEIIKKSQGYSYKLSKAVMADAINKMIVSIDGQDLKPSCYSYRAEKNLLSVKPECIRPDSAEIKIAYAAAAE